MWNNFIQAMEMFFATSGVAILHAIIIFVIGFVVINLLLKALTRVFARAKVEKIARKFLYTTIKYILYLVLIMIMLGSAGVSITGLVAVFSAAGLALSLALQGSLGNLANGVVLILSKPFKEGDVIKIGDQEGIVKEIRILNTVLKTFDSKLLCVPNKMVVESVLVNSSVLENRKMAYEFLVSYKSDVDKVKEIISKVFNASNLILSDPAPFIALKALEKDGLKFIANCYVPTPEYFNLYFVVLEEIFNEFKINGIEMPHAQLEVTLNNDKDTKLPTRKARALPQKVKTKPILKEVKIGKDMMKSEELEQLERLERKTAPILKEQEQEEIEEIDIDQEYDKDYLQYVNEINVVEENDVTANDDIQIEVVENKDSKKSKKAKIRNKKSKNTKTIIKKKS